VTKFKKIKPPEKSIASAKESAAVLSKAKPHPRPSPDKQLGSVNDWRATPKSVSPDAVNVTRSPA
jgi:hypothetical protein